MPYYLKVIITVAIVIGVTETSKRFGFWGALLASLPLTSLLAMLWLYVDTKDVDKIATFSTQVFWFVLPSLGLFIAFPILLKKFSFYPSLLLACAVTMALYALMAGIFKLTGFNPLA